MKKILIFAAIFLLVILKVSAQSDLIDEQLNLSGVNRMNQAFTESESAQIFMEDFDFNALVKNINKGESFINPQSILLRLLKIFAEEVYGNLHIMLTLIVLAIISAVITNLQSSFNSKGVYEAAFISFYIIFAGILTTGFYKSLDLTKTALQEQVAFLKAAVPTYMALMLSTGNYTTSACVSPIFLYFIQLIGEIIENFLVPGILFVFALTLVNNATEKLRITNLVKLCKKVLNWVLGTLLTAFVSLLSLSGMGSSVVDGVGLKTVKYAVGSFVPLVGGLLSDTVDTVISSTLVLKSSLGIIGVISIVLMCAYPLIKLIILIFMYKLTAGIVEPIADKRVGNIISDAATGVQMLFVLLLTVTIVFVLAITIVISFGKTTAMIK